MCFLGRTPQEIATPLTLSVHQLFEGIAANKYQQRHFAVWERSEPNNKKSLHTLGLQFYVSAGITYPSKSWTGLWLCYYFCFTIVVLIVTEAAATCEQFVFCQRCGCECELFWKKTVGTNYFDCSIELIKKPIKTRVQIQPVFLQQWEAGPECFVEGFSMLFYEVGESCVLHQQPDKRSPGLLNSWFLLSVSLQHPLHEF